MASFKLLLVATFFATSLACLGEYQVCPNGSCVMFASDCNTCSTGYLCPDRTTCVSTVEDYESCPGIKGTHLDWSLSLEDRVQYLIDQANLTEKVSQLTHDAPALERFFIPSYNWLNDDEHGVKQHHATVFPSGCSLGATWSKQTLGAVGTAIGLEARGGHNGFVHEGNRGHGQNGLGITLYAPNLNLVRDPRWGRAQEVYSEDPNLTSQLTKKFVEGIQQKNSSDYLLAAACCKHYAAYDIESIPVLRYNFSAELDSRNLWETYLPAFRACVQDAEGSHVMCSYNSINGVPTCADDQLLNGILRDQWGFDGFVVSDFDAWENLYSTHYYCPDLTCAAAAGINAGMDQEGGGTSAIDQLPDALAKNLVNMSTIDQSFGRLMKTRIQLGMFDPPTSNPWNYITNDSSVILSPEHIQLSRTAAREGICLYSNKNDTLPLSAPNITNMLVVGPQASMTDLLLGNYAVYPTAGIVSILDGINNVAPLQGGYFDVEYAMGCDSVACEDTSGFDAATALAENADVVIVTLGLDQSIEREGHDRSTLDLPQNQYALVSQLRAATNAPIVGVLVHGGTVAMHSLVDDLDAIMDAWYPGMQGGNAIADVLFGVYNPAGRTPVTYYEDDDQLGAMGDMDLYAGNGTTYRYFTGNTTYSFGYGLSYTTFSYSSLLVSDSTPSPCDSLNVTVNVTNTGMHSGDEVVQVYVNTPNSSVPTPNIRLADFERVHIPAGQSRTVSLSIEPEYHQVVQEGSDIYHPVIQVEEGPLEIYVGGGAPSYYQGYLSTTVQVQSTATC